MSEFLKLHLQFCCCFTPAVVVVISFHEHVYLYSLHVSGSFLFSPSLCSNSFANWLYKFTFPWTILTIQLLHNLTSTLISWIFFILNAIMGHAEIFFVVLLMTNDVEHFFMWLVAICISPLWIVLTSCLFLFYKATFLRKHKMTFLLKIIYLFTHI